MASPTCIFFLPLTIMWRCLFGRKAESRRGRFSLSAGCLSACGEEEADKWMGAAKEWERGRADLSVICLRFKSKLLTDERRRCLSGSSPAHKTSVWQHTLFRSFFFLLCFDVYFMSFEASTLSWSGVYLKLSLVYFLWSSHWMQLKKKKSHRGDWLQTSMEFKSVHAPLVLGRVPYGVGYKIKDSSSSRSGIQSPSPPPPPPPYLQCIYVLPGVHISQLSCVFFCSMYELMQCSGLNRLL